MTKMNIEEQKADIAEKTLKGRILEKSADIEKEKDIKLAELLVQQSKKGENNA